MKEYEETSFLPYRKVILKIIKEEKGHQALGELFLDLAFAVDIFDPDARRPLDFLVIFGDR